MNSNELVSDMDGDIGKDVNNDVAIEEQVFSEIKMEVEQEGAGETISDMAETFESDLVTDFGETKIGNESDLAVDDSSEARNEDLEEIDSELLADIGTKDVEDDEGNYNDVKAALEEFVIVEDDGTRKPLSEFPLDPATLKYETRSPHEDYQNYKDLVAGQRWHEISQQAATADSLLDAIDTTLAAHAQAEGSEETAMDEYFYLKHGRTPYTTDAYPQLADEDQPRSYTDEDILLSEVEQLRQQQENELQEDLEKHHQRP